MTENKETREINLKNGITIRLSVEGKRLRGIGEVLYQGKPLRCAEECIVPEIGTLDGLEVDHYEWLGIEQQEDRVILMTRPYFRVAHRMEWMEQAAHHRINTSSWSTGPFTDDAYRLLWILQPAAREIDGVEYAGFSYGFHYSCPGKEIYQIEDKATWELGGTAAGNTFIMRGGFDLPIAELKEDSTYFSGWDLPGIANPHIFQHLPLYSQMQGFTFQYDGEQILLTVHDRPSHVRSLYLKQRGDRKLLHFNQFCFDSADAVTTPARQILVASRKTAGHTATMNHFLRVRERLQAEIRNHYGLKLDKTKPTAHVETWEIARTEQFAPIFRQLKDWGFDRAFIMPLWRSNETDVNPRLREDRERFGITGNMCCPLELEIADCYGGWDGFKDILSTPVELGMETFTWFGSHFSSWSALQKRIPDLFAKDFNGQNNRNNYGHGLIAANQNSEGYQRYLLDAFRRAKACGLSGIFRDSHFNMATDTINYLQIPYEAEGGGATIDQVGHIEARSVEEHPAAYSMHDTEARIQRQFQQELGMLYFVESAGILGTPMCGTDYDLTRGCEYLFSDVVTGMNVERVLAYGDDPETVYFRGLSVRMFYHLNVEVNRYPGEGSLDAWWNPQTMPALHRGYRVVEPYLEQMHVLDDDRGILWTSGPFQVVMAYKDFDYPLEKPMLVKETLDDIQFAADRSVAVRAKRIYLMKSRKGEPK